VNSGAPEG